MENKLNASSTTYRLLLLLKIVFIGLFDNFFLRDSVFMILKLCLCLSKNSLGWGSKLNIPEFEYSLQKEGRNTTLICKWNAIDNFRMPLLINTGKDDFWIYPNNGFKEIDLGSFDRGTFQIRTDLFYIDIKKQ